MAAKKQQQRKFTAKMNAFICAYKGNATEAARAAGYSTPEVDGWRLMQVPEIAAKCEEKMQRILKSAEEKISVELADLDIIAEVTKLARTPPNKTKDSIVGQVRAYQLLAEMKGMIVNRHEDMTWQKLKSKSRDELRFIKEYGRDPISQDELQRFLLDSGSDSSPRA